MLGALTSLTGGGGLQGGGAGPANSSNANTTRNDSGFTGGSVNRNNGTSTLTWIVIAGLAVAAYVLFIRKR